MKMVLKGIGKIFRGIWKLISFTRQLILNLLFLLVIGVLFYAFSKGGEQPGLPDKAALVLDFIRPDCRAAYQHPPYRQSDEHCPWPTAGTGKRPV